MAQNKLDPRPERMGMEEYDLNKGIAEAATHRGISPVEMRAKILGEMVEAEGRTISDEDVALFAMGEITLSDAMGRTTSNQDLGKTTSNQDLGGKTMSDSDYITFPGGRQIRTQEKLTKDIIDSIKGKMGKKFQQWGRTLSDTDQVQALAADSLPTSDRDVLNMLQEGRTLSDQDLSGRTLSNQDLAIGRTMSNQDQQNEFLPRRVSGFRNHLQDVLAKSGATISDADRDFLQRLIASPVDPNTLSDRDRQIIQDIQGRTLSNSDAAILEMLK